MMLLGMYLLPEARSNSILGKAVLAHFVLMRSAGPIHEETCSRCGTYRVLS
jgi:hypothetical protein